MNTTYLDSVRVVAQVLENELAQFDGNLHEHVAMDRLPSSFTNAHPAIMVRQQSTTPAMPHAPVLRCQIAVHCYGGTGDFSGPELVSDHVRAVLHDYVGGANSGGVLYSELSVSNRLHEPDTGWPVCLDVYEVQTLKNKE